MTERRRLPESLTRGPFSTRDLREAGLPEDLLRQRSITKVTRGVHVVGDVDEIVRLAGFGLVIPPGSAFACHSAARLWGLPLAADVDRAVHVLAPRRLRRAGVIAHLGQVSEICTRHGLPVTSPAATFVDLAAHLDDAWLLAVGDAILRRGRARAVDLVNAARDANSRRGSVRARRVAPLVRAGVDSPMEPLLRHLLLEADLPEPVINGDVLDRHGGWIARPDLAYPDRLIAIEYDGSHHLTDRRQWENDIARRHNLEDAGWVVRVVTSRDLLRQPRRLAASMLDLWCRRG